tara:strand:+ start:511 stop:2898 length:2388 start_codon:yes stop_codon:yes gene_type:complete
MLEIFQLFEKALHIAKNDVNYILPVIGSIQILIIGIFYQKKKLIYLSSFLFLFFCAVFPLVKLIPNLGSDAFSEFQKINLSEVYFYIKTLNFFSGWSIKHYILWILIIILYILSIFILLFLSKKFSLLNFKSINYCIIFLIIIIPTFTNFYKVSVLYKSSIIEKKNQLKNIIYDTRKLNIKSDNFEDVSLVFYIGEATTRLHWSLYEYFRPTNKNLEKFKKNNSLIIYDNIYSTHTHTSPSLLDALTIKAEIDNNSEPKIVSDYLRYPIVDILNNNFINTKLYSTQAKSGSWNLSSGLIFKNAGVKKYSFKYNLGNANYIDNDKPYDHQFLKKFTDEIENDLKKNNFYVFHSYAGHGNYKKNIPKEYHNYLDSFYTDQKHEAIFGNKFKNNQKEFLENYDSAMSYVSDNIAFTLEKISNLNKPIIFIYTSDHGESPLTGLGHDSSRYVWEMSAVPFIIYFNDKAKSEYPELFKKLMFRSNQKNREILSNLPSLIFEIFNIKILDNENRPQDVTKCKFGDGNCLTPYHTIRNQLNTLGVVNLNFPPNNEKNYINNTDRASTLSNIQNYFLKKNSDLKVCSHRTNSIARFIRFNAILDCMEIDIIIDDEFLDVAHSKTETKSLKLDELLKIQNNKENTLWLDVKNLNNIRKCNQLFASLKNKKIQDKQLKFFIEFPSNIINELSIYEECIQNIKSLDFPISYYISNNIKNECAKNYLSLNSSINQCQYLEKTLKKIYDSGFFTDISFDYQNYEFFKGSKYLDKFFLNTWHIPDTEILKIKNQNFRLIIPHNDDVNYN